MIIVVGISTSSILEVEVHSDALVKDGQRFHASPRLRFRLSSRARTLLRNLTSPHLQFLKLNQFLYHSNSGLWPVTSGLWPLASTIYSMPHDLILGTAGHIDHGKTTLVKALTGIDCDRLP